MKNLEFKMRLSLLIGGLALMVCCGLQCTAQTNDAQEQSKEWGILVTQKGKDSYLFPGKGRPLFRGTEEQCKQKCDSLNAPYRNAGSGKAADKVGDRIEKDGFSISEHRPQGRVYEKEVGNFFANCDTCFPKYSATIIAKHCSMLISDNEYEQVKDDWMKIRSSRKVDFNDFVNSEYIKLCNRHGCSKNEEDFYNFDKKLRSLIKKEVEERKRKVEEMYDYENN